MEKQSPNVVSIGPQVHFLSGRALADFKGKQRAVFLRHMSSKAAFWDTCIGVYVNFPLLLKVRNTSLLLGKEMTAVSARPSIC